MKRLFVLSIVLMLVSMLHAEGKSGGTYALVVDEA